MYMHCYFKIVLSKVFRVYCMYNFAFYKMLNIIKCLLQIYFYSKILLQGRKHNLCITFSKLLYFKKIYKKVFIVIYNIVKDDMKNKKKFLRKSMETVLCACNSFLK